MKIDSPHDDTHPLRPESDPREIARRFAERSGDKPPERIGPYKILGVLGEGGMGIVYLAEQEKPIHRRVALKIIKLGMDTKQVIARFETEREALALMNHPNVAKVFDAGATETGRPYFAMEYVAGIPITDYCDKHRLSTDERLRLFMEVCQAVQHAHQKGIIHRDIKPSNVLVSVQDEKLVPKVIDFGVAKATQQRLTERTLFTEQGQLIGTPGYMSPEQAEMTALDIDTRTDIYSLGVVLYELLVGALPFDTKTLLQGGFAEIQRIIREVEPPKPSTKLSSLGADSTTIAQKRRTELRTLARQIRGDLDWIVMKCLEKDRTRRYDTANSLALEIGRYLNSEPILAGPPSTTYRMRKFVRRNKGQVFAAASILIVLLAGLGGTSFGLVQARRERAAAEQARNESDTVTQFLSDTIASADPGKEGKDVTVREVIDRAAQTIGEKFKDKPLIEARLRHTIGGTYCSLGLYSSAEAHAAEAAAVYRRTKGDQDPATLAAMENLADALSNQGRYAEAEELDRRTLEVRRHVLGEEHPDTLRSMNDLAVDLFTQGHHAKAEELNRRTLEVLRRVLGEEHPDTLKSINSLTAILSLQGRYAEAEELYRKTLEVRRRVLGEEHPDTLISMNNLASVLGNQARYAEAEELFRKTLEVQRRVLGDEHPDTLASIGNLALTLDSQARHSEAEELHRKTLEIQRRVLGGGHRDVLWSMNNLAESLENQGRYVEAEVLYRKTLEIQRDVLGEEHPDALLSMGNLGNVLSSQGRYHESEELYRKTLEIMRRVLGDKHPFVAESLYGLAAALEKMGRFADAEPLCREVESIRTSRLPAEHLARKANDNLLGAILCGLQRFSDAEPLLNGSYDALGDAGGLSQQDKREMLERLVRLYDSWDAAEPGKGYAQKAAAWREKLEELQGTKAHRHGG